MSSYQKVHEELVLFGKPAINVSTWPEVYSACVGTMTVLNDRFAKTVVKDRVGVPDLAAGKIRFGNEEYPMMLIGREVRKSGQWIWAWDMDAEKHMLSMEAKKAGDVHGILPLVIGNISLSRALNGHTLSTAACAISRQRMCYYKCTDNEGCDYVAVMCPNTEGFVDSDGFKKAAEKCLVSDMIDHDIFVKNFLAQNGTPFETDKNTVLAHFDDADLLIMYAVLKGRTKITKMVKYYDVYVN